MDPDWDSDYTAFVNSGYRPEQTAYASGAPATQFESGFLYGPISSFVVPMAAPAPENPAPPAGTGFDGNLPRFDPQFGQYQAYGLQQQAPSLEYPDSGFQIQNPGLDTPGLDFGNRAVIGVGSWMAGASEAMTRAPNQQAYISLSAGSEQQPAGVYQQQPAGVYQQQMVVSDAGQQMQGPGMVNQHPAGPHFQGAGFQPGQDNPVGPEPASPEPASPSDRHARGKKPTTACHGCQIYKRKCDKVHDPGCQQCAVHGLVCAYGSPCQPVRGIPGWVKPARKTRKRAPNRHLAASATG